ncbi:MAG: PHA/PHB synthase family protein [Hyphomicrobiales bacterium]
MPEHTPTPSDFRLADPAEFARNLAKVFELAGRIAAKIAEHPDLAKREAEAQVTPIDQVAKTLSSVVQSYASDPQKLMNAQMQLWTGYGELWQATWKRLLGEETGPVASPERNDRRFTDRDWKEHAFFDFLKQFYLISARWAVDLVKKADGIDEHTRRKARFYVEQIANAFSPSNFALTNPEVLRATLASNGANLVEGLKHLEADLDPGDGLLRIKQTDTSAFEVGKNVATTPGKVVFENDTVQLIQYEPATRQVHEIPLLIIPPWINKFYILDLNPKKSFIRWATEQELAVFVVSWVNPDATLGHKTFADYMRDGFLAAVDAVQKATGAEKINVAGYCVGGTLVACSLGWMAAKGDDRVQSVTFLAAQVDFEKAGDLLVYVDDEQVKWIEERMSEKGFLPGRRMADAFNLLRSNDLIWSYVVNNYMLGREPMPFDLLYWNADTTRMPASVHSTYLRDCYLHNRLSRGKMVLDGVAIDLKKVKVPIYNLAAREDHISPPASVIRMGRFFGGETRFLVTGSGHIAGIVNPPDARKYQYWTSDAPANGDFEEWMKGAQEHPGSWWPDWLAWIAPNSGKMVDARPPGGGKLEPIEDAPGRYVRVRGE